MNGPLTQPIFRGISLKTIFIAIGILALGFILGFAAKSTISSNNQTAEKLPVSLELLKNPIVYQWRGSVKGKITKKDAHNFTLTDDQNRSITITDITPTGQQFKTAFFDKTNFNKQASFSAIPVGSTLSGEFFILKGGPNTPVGSMFVKQ